ncbi:MAG: tRNA preQ1(34) S-adenosylmethionine ribosyltransferase-isomerase QueA [Erysipelotrichaceae bacterium]
MKVKDFDFELPAELIAQTPLQQRNESKLMVIDTKAGTISDRHFYDIVDYLQPGDVLVRNNTRVIPARLFGTKEETGAHVELLLLKQDGDNWECLVGNARVVKLDTVVSFGDGELKARCIGIGEAGIRIFTMIYEGIFFEVLDHLGNVPLPPYIHETLEDKERYQTVYAKVKGSAAAPTAGLHFTDALFETLEAMGVSVLDVTLHIGLGTFRPIGVDDILDHDMHSEYYILEADVAEKLNAAKAAGRRIIAVGTTSARVLEANQQKHGSFQAEAAATNIFIYPGYKFLGIDGLITNFHLPKSTLIMLVSAFAGKDLTMRAYAHAISERYRFFSFGDSSFFF